MDEETWNEIEGVREWKGKDQKGFYTIDKDGREHGWVYRWFMGVEWTE